MRPVEKGDSLRGPFLTVGARNAQRGSERSAWLGKLSVARKAQRGSESASSERVAGLGRRCGARNTILWPSHGRLGPPKLCYRLLGVDGEPRRRRAARSRIAERMAHSARGVVLVDAEQPPGFLGGSVSCIASSPGGTSSFTVSA